MSARLAWCRVGYRAGMQSLALFDLDDTLIDRRAAFNAWAEEFVAAQGLDDAALTFPVMADARHSGPMDGFFTMVCRTFDLAEPPSQLWLQYRRRMPELASCRAEDLDALRRLRRAGWRIGIATGWLTTSSIRSEALGWTGWSTRGASPMRSASASLIVRSSACRCALRRQP
jgi:phosphoserine phosphatase